MFGSFKVFSRKRTRVDHPNTPEFYSAHAGDLFTPGAQIFAFNPKFSNPVYVVRGAGVIPSRQFRALQPPQVRQHLALPTSPYQGFPVGSLALQGLEDSTPQ